MKIYSSTIRDECDVFAISISFDTFWPISKRVIFYAKDVNTRGLFAEELNGAKILDNTLESNFKFHIINNGDGVMILSNYFSDIDHLARLMDFDPETVDSFEKAIASFPNSIG